MRPRLRKYYNDAEVVLVDDGHGGFVVEGVLDDFLFEFVEVDEGLGHGEEGEVVVGDTFVLEVQFV